MTFFPRNTAMTRKSCHASIFPDFQILDAAGPIAAFEIAERYAPDAYEHGGGGRAGRRGGQFVGRRLRRPGAVRRRLRHHPGRRRRRARGALRRARRRRGLVAPGRAARRGASPASAPAPICWPRRACWTASAPPPTGAAPTTSRGAIRHPAGARPDLRARGRGLDLGRDHRRHRPGPGADRGRPGRRDRAAARPSSWWSTSAGRAASRSSPRCWRWADPAAGSPS